MTRKFDEAKASGDRDAVLERVRMFIREGRTIRFSAPDPVTMPGGECAEFSGAVGPYRYQFEGEDDLLHVIVTRSDGGRLAPEEGQTVAAFLLGDVPPSLVWIRPGEFSQHFYLGHELLL